MRGYDQSGYQMIEYNSIVLQPFGYYSVDPLLYLVVIGTIV